MDNPAHERWFKLRSWQENDCPCVKLKKCFGSILSPSSHNEQFPSLAGWPEALWTNICGSLRPPIFLGRCPILWGVGAGGEVAPPSSQGASKAFLKATARLGATSSTTTWQKRHAQTALEGISRGSPGWIRFVSVLRTLQPVGFEDRALVATGSCSW